jgi:hypothetical protein
MVEFCPICDKFFLTPESLARHNRNYHQSEFEEDKPRKRPEQNAKALARVILVPVAKPVKGKEGHITIRSKNEIINRNVAEQEGTVNYYSEMEETTICSECKKKTLLRGRCMNPDCNYSENRRACCRG